MHVLFVTNPADAAKSNNINHYLQTVTTFRHLMGFGKELRGKHGKYYLR